MPFWAALGGGSRNSGWGWGAGAGQGESARQPGFVPRASCVHSQLMFGCPGGARPWLTTLKAQPSPNSYFLKADDRCPNIHPLLASATTAQTASSWKPSFGLGPLPGWHSKQNYLSCAKQAFSLSAQSSHRTLSPPYLGTESAVLLNAKKTFCNLSGVAKILGVGQGQTGWLAVALRLPPLRLSCCPSLITTHPPPPFPLPSLTEVPTKFSECPKMSHTLRAQKDGAYL